MSRPTRCPKCDIELLNQSSMEQMSHFIGDAVVPVVAYVPKAECGRCGWQWEDAGASTIRNDAFNKSIEKFWLEKFGNYVGPTEVGRLRRMFRTAIERVGGSRPRAVAEALAHWLSDTNF